jgi:hypothetical protein
MNIDLLSLALAVPLGAALVFVVYYSLKDWQDRRKLKRAREMWRQSRNASFINLN